MKTGLAEDSNAHLHECTTPPLGHHLGSALCVLASCFLHGADATVGRDRVEGFSHRKERPPPWISKLSPSTKIMLSEGRKHAAEMDRHRREVGSNSYAKTYTFCCPCFSPEEHPPDSRKFATSRQTDSCEIQEAEAGPCS